MLDSGNCSNLAPRKNLWMTLVKSCSVPYILNFNKKLVYECGKGKNPYNPIQNSEKVQKINASAY